MKKTSVMTHALSMVIKNKRAYIMLSVTIVMSFVFLLSFLIYTDSKVLTENVESIKQEPYLFETNLNFVDYKTRYTYINNLSGIDKTDCFMVENLIAEKNMLDEYDTGDGGISIVAVPNNSWGVYVGKNYELVNEDNSSINISKDKVLLREDLYETLKASSLDGKVKISIPIKLKNGNIKYIHLDVSGGYRLKNSYEDFEIYDMIISQELVRELDYEVSNLYMYIYTEYPSKVQEISENLSLSTTSVYEDRFKDYPAIQRELKNKAFIAIILFILLGINLYSSFNNALNERKFEIGVKRAIGASSKDIILQFMWEGIIVVFTNIIISTILSVSIFIGYKWYMNVIKDTVYIFNISKYSIVMHLIASVFLTLAFSLIFAFQSARVEIIRYIKGE